MAEHREQVVSIAGADDVWRLIYDVSDWPSWTPTVSRATVLTSGPLQVGSRVQVKQPRLPSATWTVTEMEQARNFVWESTRAGVTSRAGHFLESTHDGCRIILTFEQSGRGAWLTSRLFGRLIREYVATEAASLKRRAEHGRPAREL